jgi:hypothetical protein
MSSKFVLPFGDLVKFSITQEHGLIKNCGSAAMVVIMIHVQILASMWCCRALERTNWMASRRSVPSSINKFTI